MSILLRKHCVGSTAPWVEGVLGKFGGCPELNTVGCEEHSLPIAFLISWAFL